MKNIKADFLVLQKEGIYCPYGNFYLDPQEPVVHAIISHAHGDHARPGNATVYCTFETMDIMLLRLKKSAGKFDSKSYYEEFELNGVSITFLPAGHILGSAMVRLEYEGVVYLYTGDFKLQQDETCAAAAPCKADVLITETTFANPDVSHPQDTLEILKLNYIESNILLGVYGLGKAQRLTQLINRYCTNKRIHLHYSIYPVHELYRKHGVELGDYGLYNRKSLKQQLKHQIYMVPPLTFSSYQKATGVARVFASGWENLQRGNDLSLYISDHADWQEIMSLIESVQPSQIWTLHGDGRFLKDYLKNKIEVKIL